MQRTRVRIDKKLETGVRRRAVRPFVAQSDLQRPQGHPDGEELDPDFEEELALC